VTNQTEGATTGRAAHSELRNFRIIVLHPQEFLIRTPEPECNGQGSLIPPASGARRNAYHISLLPDCVGEFVQSIGDLESAKC
jgi:hypothetical protein